MVSIAHWLDTFTCSKYADRFERSGYQNLESVRYYHSYNDSFFLFNSILSLGT
jgi:hypothetical protein